MIIRLGQTKNRSKESKDGYALKIPPIRPNTEHRLRKIPSRSASDNQRFLLRGLECRYRSNESPPVRTHEQTPQVPPRGQCQTQKKHRKESSKPNLAEVNILRSQAQPRKHCNSKTFIGSKLKKKIQKYLLFLSLVNYSLRCNYMRSERRVYKVYIGKGNNSKLIRQIFDSRFWWTVTNNQGEADLVWSQKTSKRAMERINIFKPQSRLTNETTRTKQRSLRPRSSKARKALTHEEGFEQILSQRDTGWFSNNCQKEMWMQDLKSAIKKAKLEKRKMVYCTHNHIEGHRILTNKKNLFTSIMMYCKKEDLAPFDIIPVTFHVESEEPDLRHIIKYEEECQMKNQKLMWIIKPGQNSNRGCGIEVYRRAEQVTAHIEKNRLKHPSRTWIVQKYINPYLLQRRKFDIRCFVLVTATPSVSAYFYPVGYLRTSSCLFTKRNCSNRLIHLTNDAVQKKGGLYSRFESANKASFEDLQRHIELIDADRKINFFTDILPKMKQMVVVSLKAANDFGNSSKQHTFELFGYDFMLDSDLKPWLIEINTNPSLSADCQLLDEIIPSVIENAVKIAVDSVFRPPKLQHWVLNQLLTCPSRVLQSNQFELIYSQSDRSAKEHA